MTFAAAIPCWLSNLLLYQPGLPGLWGQLHAAAEKVRTGDFAVEVDIHTNDELEILGDSFNSMVQDLQNLLEESVEHEEKIYGKWKLTGLCCRLIPILSTIH